MAIKTQQIHTSTRNRSTAQNVILLLGLLSIVLSSVMVQDMTVLHEQFSWNDTAISQPSLQNGTLLTIPVLQEQPLTENMLQQTQQRASTSSMPQQPTSFDGVEARAWKPYPVEQQLCFETRQPQRNLHGNGSFPLSSMPFDKKYMTDRGIVFLKPMKVGGSSASGVNLRIAKNMAERLQRPYSYCENNFDHALGWMMGNRKRNQSFLWTLLREPTKRAVSGFYHFHISRYAKEHTLENFIATMEAATNYYMKSHSFYNIPYNRGRPKVVKAANDIMANYDFMAITERFDESMVVLQMLLEPHNVTLGDILYVKAKSKGGYDDGGHNGQCTFIQPTNLTAEMKDYLQSDEWQKRVAWDKALYQAANRSLDMTIDKLGRDNVSRKLKLYTWAQGLVKSKCAPEAKLPCTPDGVKRAREETNCLFTDSGCANECLDALVKDELSSKING